MTRKRSRPDPRIDAPIRVVRKHHTLVRLSHWGNVPLLLGLIASGLSIYWAAPVFQHTPDPATRSRDYVADAGVAIARVTNDRGGDPRNWIYDHLALGTRQLAVALRLHWALAYLFMLNGALYAIGLIAGGGWRALLPRRTDLAEGLAMIRFYLGVVPMAILRRPWPHPVVHSKYNALQRSAYFAMPILGALVVLSGWAMHKPVQLGWLERMFVSYDGARIVHFACMLAFASFIVPHVVLAIADGWDTVRSMVVGWSARVRHPETPVAVPRPRLIAESRRDFLLFTAGTLATIAGAWWLLPDRTKSRLLPGARRQRLDTLAARAGLSRENRERVLNGALSFDDDVAEALYSKDRRVRTYELADVSPRLKNNYHGRTPGPEFLPTWALTLSGLASGRVERLPIERLVSGFTRHEQITRLVCVEGWSAIAWWGGFRFADLLAAFPPVAGTRWAAMRSTVSLDARGRPETYFVSLDLETARHPQTLLATHHAGHPLTLAHGAPLRLIAPMKLGLKNIKAITDIEYTAEEPPDYWAAFGYSRYDGL